MSLWLLTSESTSRILMDRRSRGVLRHKSYFRDFTLRPQLFQPSVSALIW
ncbi:hypothetical protein JK628_02515 [Shewanella sp. KX20019]|nr:hypothetical protein JK628_02515 [Shewanella sp. KX20019]